MDKAGNALTLEREPTHLADPDLTFAIALSLDTKGKSPQTRWQHKQEAMDEELQRALYLCGKEAFALALRALGSPIPQRERSKAAGMASRSTFGATTTYADGWTSKRSSDRIRATSLAQAYSRGPLPPSLEFIPDSDPDCTPSPSDGETDRSEEYLASDPSTVQIGTPECEDRDSRDHEWAIRLRIGYRLFYKTDIYRDNIGIDIIGYWF